MVRKLFFVCLLVLLAGVVSADTVVSAEQTKFVRRDIRDIVVQQDGTVYALDRGRRQVLKLDPAGNLLWHAPITESKYDLYALVRASSPWNILVVSNGEPLRDVSSDGKVTELFRWIGAYSDRICAVDQTGRMFVPNGRLNRVEIYVEATKLTGLEAKPLDLPGLLLKENNAVARVGVIDGTAPGPTHLSGPHAVHVDYISGRIWVLDNTYVFKVYDKSGAFLFNVKASDPKNRSFTGIGCMEFDAAGNTYMASAEMHGMLKYDRNGRLVKKTILDGGPEGLGPDGSYYAVLNNGEMMPDGKPTLAEIRVYSQDGKLLRAISIPES